MATVLAAGSIALGFIEGVVEAIVSFSKLWSGQHSDVVNGRRKGLTLAGSWFTLLVLRSIDRIGKGQHSAPRDA